ncbi:hypothetical protein CC80DRAFT_271733 [Byssothecium circinans]|uniref:Uncharacterized protein n=1 Tax=Byssothecium circinans TaxID=147558 RepID=A0A6A5TCI0_9PLEO|nr:hypothetical protein CC80DRAFT_271733 [Byssothecium circinans]
MEHSRVEETKKDAPNTVLDSGLVRMGEHKVTTLPNGLVSLEKTPTHLVGTVKRNSLASPLLRLPTEIREVIWQYATSHRVSIAQVENQKTLRVYEVQGHGKPAERNYEPRSCFRLPEVSRQIYSETATLVYSNTIFGFGLGLHKNFELVRTWADGLVQAQRNAITDVSVNAIEFFVIRKALFSQKDLVPMRRIFPALQRIHVSDELFEIGINVLAMHDPRYVTLEGKAEHYRRWIKGMFGGSVELIFTRG